MHRHRDPFWDNTYLVTLMTLALWSAVGYMTFLAV